MASSVPNEKAPPSEAQPATNPQATSNSDPSKAPATAYPQQQPNQYVVGVPPQQGQIPMWSTGLFDCFDDLPTLIITAFAPCVTFGQVAEMVDRGQNSCMVLGGLHAGLLYFTGLGCLLSAYFRIRMVQMYNLPNDPVINILVHLVCEPCALCQEYRELQAHGFDMKLGLGWKGQSPEIQQTGGAMVPPTVPGGMTR
ncbi:unnamed protein product [Lactuca saligna]|uniref:PLAC8 motif-containing protein n=1 Tax=Lactuca saligna TaxID=75948 RepID=A0AA36EI47_LACSI|nr:unnamed protein product [Lactuca saligna]